MLLRIKALIEQNEWLLTFKKVEVKNMKGKFITKKHFGAKITVEANATLTGTIDGLNADKLYYLTFSAPSDFSGSVY